MTYHFGARSVDTAITTKIHITIWKRYGVWTASVSLGNGKASYSLSGAWSDRDWVAAARL